MSATISDTPHAQYAEDGDENEVNFMLTPDMRPEVKSEPTDVSGAEILAMNGEFGPPQKKPTITLTPTMKLLASPYPMDPKRRFTCPYDNCTKSYGKSSHLRSHLTWHTGIKPYVCHERNCGKSFTRSDELNRHSRTHTGEKPFECMQCAKKFSRSDHLTKHVATHTKQTLSQKRVHTSVATETTEAQSETPVPKKELTELTEMSLPEEGMNYNDGMHFMASLLECAQFKHGRHVIEPENLTESADHLPIRIKLERPEHSSEYKVVNAVAVDEEEQEKKHQIAITTEVQPVPLKQEIAEAYDPLDIKPEFDATGDPMPVGALVRDEAEEEDFSEEDSEVADHENTNDNSIMPEANAPPLPQAGAPLAVPRFDLFEGEVLPERPYRCLQCGKCFKRQDDLTRHLRTHTGEKPYACINCDRRFNRSDHMKKHLKTHSKERAKDSESVGEKDKILKYEHSNGEALNQ